MSALDPSELIQQLVEAIPWSAIIAYLGVGLASAYVFLRLLGFVKGFIAYRRGLNGKAIVSNYVRLRDGEIWEVKSIKFSWVQLHRKEGSGVNQKHLTKWIRTEEWVKMEITTVQ